MMKPVKDKEQNKIQETEMEQISGGVVLDSFDSVQMTVPMPNVKPKENSDELFKEKSSEMFSTWMQFTGSNQE